MKAVNWRRVLDAGRNKKKKIFPIKIAFVQNHSSRTN